MTGRNEPCACGSGKKSKHCCAKQGSSATQSGRLGLIVGAIVLVGVLAIITTSREGSQGESSSPSAPSSAAPTGAPTTVPMSANPTAPAADVPVATPGPQPPGPAPQGKVWSPEHGHWHDKVDANPWVKVNLSNAPGSTPATTPGQAAAPQSASIPKPDVPTPPGKVWSPEHGHWHDAATGVAPTPEIPADLESQMKPPSVPEAPAGMVWSPEHKHWHKVGAAPHGTTTSTAPATTTNPQ